MTGSCDPDKNGQRWRLEILIPDPDPDPTTVNSPSVLWSVRFFPSHLLATTTCHVLFVLVAHRRVCSQGNVNSQFHVIGSFLYFLQLLDSYVFRSVRSEVYIHDGSNSG